MSEPEPSKTSLRKGARNGAVFAVLFLYTAGAVFLEDPLWFLVLSRWPLVLMVVVVVGLIYYQMRKGLS